MNNTMDLLLLAPTHVTGAHRVLPGLSVFRVAWLLALAVSLACVPPADAGPNDIRLHVIGLGVSQDTEVTTQLKAIAVAGGGTYSNARNSEELNRLLVASVNPAGFLQTYLRMVLPVSGLVLVLAGVIAGLVVLLRQRRHAIRLVARDVDGKTRTATFRRSSIIIGRSPSCDFVIGSHDRRVSRRHARLDVGQETMAIENLGSGSATLVRGAPVRGLTRVGPGDRIQIGSHELWVEVF